MREAFAAGIYELSQTRDDIFLVVADISPASALKTFLAKSPTRLLDVGISEQALIGVCAGLAIQGFRPYAYSIANFSAFRPFEQIRVDLCYQSLPVCVVGVGAGLSYSSLGGTHHTIEDLAVLGSLPEIVLLTPSDPLEVRALVAQSALLNAPSYLRLGKSGEPSITADAPEPCEIGRIRLLRHGTGPAIVGYGPILAMAFEALQDPTAPTDVAIYSVPSLRPFDDQRMTDILTRHPRVLLLEEHINVGGLGAAILSEPSLRAYVPSIRHLHLQHRFLHVYGSHRYLLSQHGITPESILAGILSND